MFWILRLLPVLLACLLWQLGGAMHVNVGTPADVDIVEGFHERENNTDLTYRWSSHDATLTLPARYMPAIVEVQGTVVPDETQVTLSTGDGSTMALRPQTGVPLIRHYTFLYPPQHDSLGWAHIHITAQPSGTMIEERPLGLLVKSLSVSSVAGTLSLPPLLLLLILALIPLSLEAGLRLYGVSARWSLGVSLPFGLFIVATWWKYPLWIQQFLPVLLLALLFLLAMFWWTRRVTTKPQGMTRANILVILVAWSASIPLYLFLQYGLEDIWHPGNLPIVAMVAALVYPFVGQQLRWTLTAVMVLALAGYGFIEYFQTLSTDYTSDFTALFRGPRSFLNGENPYDLEVIHGNHLVLTYKYPPFFFFLMGPLTGLPYVPGLIVWRLINILLLGVTLYLMWRWSKRPLRSWSTLGLGYLLLTYQPLNYTIGFGQFDIFILLALAAALLFIQRDKWGWYGAVLAFPAAVKFYPAYLVAHGVARRHWRSMLAFVASFALLWGLAIVVFGWDIHRIYMFEIMPTLRSGTVWPENQTINGFLNRLAANSIEFGADAPGFIRWVAYLGMLVFTIWTFIRAQYMDAESGFGIWIVAMLIVIPIAWIHYQTILLLPMYQLFVRLDRDPQRLRWQTLALYSLAWMLLCYGSHWAFFDQTYHGPVWGLVLSYKLYGMLFLWFALASDATTRTATVQAAEKNTNATQSTNVSLAWERLKGRP
jgi:hypothetical protein